MSTITLEVTRSFDAAHSLAGTFDKNHPCSRVHGHHYDVTIAVSGVNDDAAILVDYHVLQTSLDHAIAKLDHQYLNDILDAPTTCENLCRWFREQLRTMASCHNLVRVEVSEQRDVRCILDVKKRWSSVDDVTR